MRTYKTLLELKKNAFKELKTSETAVQMRYSLRIHLYKTLIQFSHYFTSHITV